MANDKFFQKRKAKKKQDLARREAQREPYSRVLLVVEGSKTEVLYFQELKNYFGIATANFEIDNNNITSPIQLTNRAERVYLKSKDKQDPFDKVFVIFDRDSHESYYEAIQRCNTLGRKNLNTQKQSVFEAIYSYPCFEFWYLLHFTPTSRPYSAKGSKSIADCCIDDLKNYLPEYKKSDDGYFERFLRDGSVHFAIENSRRILSQIENNGDNPCTNVHIVVDYLMNVKSEK